MKRLARQVTIVVVALALALPAGEGLLRLALRIKGQPHDGALRRSNYEQNLAWIRDPSGVAQGQRSDDDVQQTPSGKTFKLVFSPFIGVELDVWLEEYQDITDYFAGPSARADFDVLVLGGSVAGIVGQEGAATLREVLGADPRLAGSNVRIFGQGRGGFKAPQTSHLASMLFQLGWEPDLVVLIDGFNEVALGNHNRVNGAHPLYPSLTHWGSLVSQLSDSPPDLAILAEIYGARSAMRGVLERALRLDAHRSAIGSKVTDVLLARHRARDGAARARLEASFVSDSGMNLAIRGPFPPGDLEAGLRDILRIWSESSLSMAGMCRVRSIPFVHILQPTLYDPGAKLTITANERQVGVITPIWKEGVVEGYPLLRERGAELRARGVDFFDGSKLYLDWARDVYYDCCHMNQEGARALARYAAEAARSLDRLTPQR